MERFMRAELAAFKGYSAREAAENISDEITVAPEAFIKLDANENLYGCSPGVGRALAAFPDFNIYSDATQTELRRLLAGYTGAAPEAIVAGSGSGDLIDLLLRLFVAPDDEVIVSVPAFTMFDFSCRMYGARLVAVPRRDDFTIDLATMQAAVTDRTKLIMLDNPNNPTGNLTARDDIMALADTGVPLLVDEAYVEFAGETVVPLTDKYPNLMVLRTFSKWAGLAGLRVGYGIFPPAVVRCLMTIKLPYNVNAAAIVAVRESLRDIDYLMRNVDAIITERERLYQALKGCRLLAPFPSRANFILCRVAGEGKASDLQRGLRRRGIMVRYFDTPRLRDYVRISIGRPEHSDTLLTALREIEEETNDEAGI